MLVLTAELIQCQLFIAHRSQLSACFEGEFATGPQIFLRSFWKRCGIQKLSKERKFGLQVAQGRL